MTYYVYSIDSYGYQNRGSFADRFQAFNYCDRIHKNNPSRSYWVSNHREGLNHICRYCGGLVAGWSEPHRCKNCHDASLDRAEAAMGL